MRQLSDFPLEELKHDLFETIVDIKVCQLALLHGHTIYGDGENTGKRLETNIAIRDIINGELKRREMIT